MSLIKTKLVFLDTNIYLHYQFFDEIDWLKLLHTEAVIIIIPPVVIDELNKHKELHPRPRVKKRAGAVLKKLSILFDTTSTAYIRDNVEVFLEDRAPLIDFELNRLNPLVQDDILIGGVIEYRNENPDAEIVLVTSDTGLTLLAKARRQRITTFKVPDNLKLPNEPDPNQQQIKKLEDEIRKLQSAMPRLSLASEDENQRYRFILPRPNQLTANEIMNKLEEIRNLNPKIELPTDEQFSQDTSALGFRSSAEIIAALAADRINRIPAESIAEYNDELDEFFHRYQKYLQDRVSYNNLRRRTIKLEFLLINSGTKPAEDIDIYMHFPDGFQLFNEDNFPDPPIVPEPPSKPKTSLELLGSANRVLSSGIYNPSLRLMDLDPTSTFVSLPSNVTSLNIKHTSSYDVDFHVQRLKHQKRIRPELLYIVFDSFEEAKSFSIDYKILSANVPQEVTGTLNVIIQKEE
ncbi:MAG: hypothetical protein KDJ65_21155 [Anaerolineae bacterium]|nr:hypothetical protein [Anaerolineae bacterium]